MGNINNSKNSDPTALDNRMKDYEIRNRYYLQKRIPVICRLDMRSGHTFLKGFRRPFDEIFVATMQETALYLCKNIQGVKLSYQQSDEITLLLTDYETFETDRFFEYRVDKLCSIIASMATLAFNKILESHIKEYIPEDIYELHNAYKRAMEVGAVFDCRCFNLPKEEVTNNFYWRQLDASRNSVQMLGQAYFTDKELKNKSNYQVQDMLMEKYSINWNNLPTHLKRGSCCRKITNIIGVDECGEFMKNNPHWIIDKDIPIFKNEGRSYIEELI